MSKKEGEKKIKFKFVNNPHISLDKKEICKKEHCKNVHLWFNKRFGFDQYAVSFNDIEILKKGIWCLAKEICIKEEGIVKVITGKLETEPNLLYVEISKEFFNEIFKGNEKNWKLNIW